MEIWIKQEEKEIRIPVLPPSFEIRSPQNNKTVNISQLGEINIMGNKGLREVSFSSFFPLRKYDSSIVEYSGYPKPYDFVKKIEDMKRADICKIIITGVITMLCTIENFIYLENDGTGDVSYTIDFKEYIKLKAPKTAPKKVEKSTTKIEVPVTDRKVKTVKSTVYTVKKGDTLMKIAKMLTGDSKNYMAIANQNSIKNPDLIYPGQKLVINV